MTNTTKKDDGKIRDIDIRLKFVKDNMSFFEQEGTNFVNEFGINSTNIVDLALFDFKNKLFYGFEIKSEQDNTKRLFKQLNAYITFFQVINVIAFTNQILDVEEILDSHKQFDKIGLIEVDRNLEFTILRRAGVYKPYFPLFAQNLELEELKLLAHKYNLPMAGSKGVLLSKLRRYITLDEILQGLKSKINNYHVHKCHKCGCSLYYMKNSRAGKARVCYKCGELAYYIT